MIDTTERLARAGLLTEEERAELEREVKCARVERRPGMLLGWSARFGGVEQTSYLKEDADSFVERNTKRNLSLLAVDASAKARRKREAECVAAVEGARGALAWAWAQADAAAERGEDAAYAAWRDRLRGLLDATKGGAR